MTTKIKRISFIFMIVFFDRNLLSTIGRNLEHARFMQNNLRTSLNSGARDGVSTRLRVAMSPVASLLFCFPLKDMKL